MMKKYLLLILFVIPSLSAMSAPLSYQLTAELVAENTWVLQGKLEDFSKRNGGNIVNTGFIVTGEGVIVIDTGPSLRYGKAMRALIESKTSQPIRMVFNTHHHPDHFLGNQAFDDIPIYSLPQTQKYIKLHGDAFAENMYRLVGDWMRSTESLPPTKALESSDITLGKHKLKLLSFTGHSGSDLVIYDETTGVLFASDMVFYQRALTTPHTPGIDIWRGEIKRLKQISYKLLVPGHGPIVSDQKPLKQMDEYLAWLDLTLQTSAEQGLSMTEVIQIPIAEKFSDIALTRREFARTVAHLYPHYEEAAF